MNYSNVNAVPLSLAVFLATDSYDYNDNINYISVTTLIKPVRQVVLGARVPVEDATVDLINMMQARIGTAVHDGIERSWIHNYAEGMTALGYPKKVIGNIRLNPEPEDLFDGCIPIYLEQRLSKVVGKWTVTGKFDFIGDGRLEDFKTTSTYTWVNGSNDEHHLMQGSMYRWLNPQLITKGEMAIQFIFTDWSKMKAMADQKYPQQRTMQRIHVLKSVNEMQAFVERKLAAIEQYWDAPEETLPLCTDKELWRSEPVFKYYKNPTKTTRSTKNFDTRQEAFIRMAEDNNVGVVKEVPGSVTACRYCQAFSICSQKDALIASGDLVV